jgi:hypothetical protein
MPKTKEVLEELQSVLKGKGIDTILPPLLFAIANNITTLPIASGLAIGVAFIIGVLRWYKKQVWYYALAGFLGVAFASSLALLANNAKNYFLPGIISSVLFSVGILITLIIRKPVAALASHLTRGWPLDWFWRKDIKPAYTEVTWMWFTFVTLRTILQIILINQQDVASYAWINALLGLPVTILVLIISYVYGMWRLKNLKGPGVEEFTSNQKAPFKGQTRGF